MGIDSSTIPKKKNMEHQIFQLVHNIYSKLVAMNIPCAPLLITLFSFINFLVLSTPHFDQ